jgi:hypothetical protein
VWRAGPFAAAGLAAAIAAVLLVRHQGGGGSSRAPAGDLHAEAGAAAVELREARAARRILPRRTPGSGELPVGGSGSAAPESSVARFIESHSAHELALLSRFEQLTGRPAPAGLLEILERRREGAQVEELEALATRRFEGDPLGRAAVLEWLGEGSVR